MDFKYISLRFFSIIKNLSRISNINKSVIRGKYTRIYSIYSVENSYIGDYSYVGPSSKIMNTRIGKFCSIGPNFHTDLGIHPTTGLSTSPMFYSTRKQNGITLTNKDLCAELGSVIIGNDVFIGANVSILPGVNIGDGAIIGTGAVVTKDIPPYAIAVGVPAKVIKYRFSDDHIKDLLEIKWWNFEEKQLKDIVTFFDDIDGFIKHIKSKS